MNERIKKLIEECTFIYDDMVYNGTDSYMKTSEYFDKEKFAELIVKECVQVTLETIYNNGIGNSEDCLIVGNTVADHFGVEE